jgi:tyrosyl-tRNA synthetase
MNFVEELKWRGMIHDIMPGTEEQLKKEMTSAYVGIDPTADSLHIGHLVSVMMLKHFQKAGHKPILLLGGATGMIGDPSGKSEERNLLDEATLQKNQDGISKQLKKILDFNANSENKAELVNNYDWMKGYSFLEFIRDIGKHLTVNYMMAKDSVKKRMSEESNAGLSFTEFSYQLVQGYDFLFLYQNKNCKLQMGGSDQWGNITTGNELIRRKTGGEAFALTWPLITKSDGTKFGKTEKGNIWLDPNLTSPYEFYQFCINTSDSDAEKYIKIFTLLTCDEINTIIDKHKIAPHLRFLQSELAKNLTIMIHDENEYLKAIEASDILFGKGTRETLSKLDEKTFLNIFDGIEQFEIDNKFFEQGIGIIELLAEKTQAFPSKSDLRRLIKDNGLTINQEKQNNPEYIFTEKDLLNKKYILGRKGKKNYFLIITTN